MLSIAYEGLFCKRMGFVFLAKNRYNIWVIKYNGILRVRLAARHETQNLDIPFAFF